MRRILVAWGVVATLLAQQPQLQAVGVTSARGGDVMCCVFDAVGDRMLTAGLYGDLVHHDLVTLVERSRHEVPAPNPKCLWLHPREQRALVATPGFAGIRGVIFSLDLESGQWMQVGQGDVELFAGDERGERVAWYGVADGQRFVEVWSWAELGKQGSAPLHRRDLDAHRWERLRFDGERLVLSNLPFRAANVACVRVPLDGAPLETARERVDREMVREGYAASDDQRFAAVLSKDKESVRELRPQQRRWDLAERRSRRAVWLRVAPRGELLVADLSGQLHVLGPEHDRYRLAAMHRAPVLDVVWTPDGRYLAVLAAGGARFVDRSGKHVGEHIGTCVVVPGNAGPEFVVYDRSGFERMHAPTGRRIGDRVTYSTPPPSLHQVEGHRLPGSSGYGGLLVVERVADGGLLLVAPQSFGSDVIAIDDEGCVGALSLENARHDMPLARVLAVASSKDQERTLLVWGSPHYDIGQDLFAPSIVVQTVAADGRELAHVDLPARPLWLRRCRDGERFVLGFDDGQVREFDPDYLEQSRELRAVQHDEPPLQWFDFVDEHRGLGGDGKHVWWIDTRTFARTPALLPAGVGDHCSGVVAPDGKHVALIHGCDVTIAAIR